MLQQTPNKPAKDKFVMVPLWWAEHAARATKSPKAFVWVWLLHLAWEAKTTTFPLPNSRLKKCGVDRQVKRRALADLEKAGLIVVQRRGRQCPIVTLVVR